MVRAKMPQPEHGIVQVLDDGAQAVGLGFVVGRRQVITCAHVVNSALGRDQREVAAPPDRPVWLRFPFSGEEVVRIARIAVWSPHPAEMFELADVCGLVLSEPMPEPALPLTFADEGSSPATVQMWGPSPLRETGGHVTGELQGAVDAVRLQVDQQIGGAFVARAGFSGGPVWNRATGQVVGMLQAVGREDVYVIRPDVLLQAWPDVLFRPPPSPYVGLRAFGANDRGVFFGREEFVGTLVADAARIPLIVVMGPSGSGKSSTIDAGLVPRLTATGRTAAVRMRPGRMPARALAWALWPSEDPDAGVARLRAHGLRHCVRQFLRQAGFDRCVIVVDQGEELITRATEDGFLDLLDEMIHGESDHAGPPDIVVAMTIRADYFGQLIVAHERVGDYVREHARTLRQMSEPELRAAISQPLLSTPAPRIGIRESLVDQLCADFRGRPGELPLLQFALTRVWEAQRDRELTLESYQRIGGTAALAQYADERVALLSEIELAAARRILTSLILPGTEDVGRPVARSELRDGDWPIVERLEQDRLVVTKRSGREDAQQTVEVAHEALLRGWHRLREWLHDDREFREWRLGTASLQNTWLDNGKDRSLLLRGPVLARAEAMVSSHPEDTHGVRPFVEESRAAEDAEERHRRDLTARAEALHLSARAELADVTSHLGREEALLLDICSLRRFPTVEANRALHRRASGSTILLSRFQAVDDDHLGCLAFHPHADVLAAASGDSTVRVWDLATGRELHRLTKAVFTKVTAVAFDVAGTRLAIGYQYLDTEVWDLATGRQLNQLAYEGSVEGLAFHPDGTRLATGGDRITRVWDLSKHEGTVVQRIEHRANSVAFDPEGSLLATAGFDHSARVWDLATGTELTRLDHEKTVTVVTFSSEGKRLATACADMHGRPDTVARVWNLDTGQVSRQLAFDASYGSYDVAFHLDSDVVATRGTDRTARVWALDTGEELHRLIHDSPAYAVAFDPDGRHVVTGTADGAILLWDLNTHLETFTAPADDDRWFDDAALHPDGTRMAAACHDSALVWDLSTGEELHRLHSREVHSVAFDPTGPRLAIGTRAASVLDLETGQELHRFSHRSIVNGVAFHPDGTLLASCSSDGTARLWDLETGQESVRLPHFAGAGDEDTRDDGPSVTVYALDFDQDGGRIATASSDNSARVWQLPAGRVIHHLAHPRIVQDVAFHPSGALLATACEDGIVRVWDMTTGTEVRRFTTDVALYAVAFDPLGARLAAGSHGMTHVWEMKNGDETHRLYSAGFLRRVAFDASGVRLATADKTVHIWDLRTEALIEQARARLTRNLNPDEWHRYLPGQAYQKFREDLP
ncbi:hypothetical protein GCM10022255_111160 [Dactylosporangium darangshiense]|uniref:Uncharacterized protein n=2 Tax=Dactylosporangium darangshiense TaxID=579108 RepID=A0ABP8DUP6_9ACTN